MGRFERIGERPVKRRASLVRHGLHMIRTEATFDEALEIIRQKQKHKREVPNALSLKQVFGLSRGLATMKSVTLSDRVQPGKRNVKRPALGKSVWWTKPQVIAAHATGNFSYRELGRMANITRLECMFWVHGLERPPVDWDCGVCGRRNSSAKAIQNGKQPWCIRCLCYWWEGLPVRAD